MELLLSLWNVVVALAAVVVALVQFLIPWIPLIAWVAFWLLAVNWKKLYPILMRGGILGVVLTGLMVIAIWSLISSPAGGSHFMYGLQVSNVVGKTVYVTSLTVIAMLCGSVQLSGCCDAYCKLEEAHVEEVSHGH